MDLFNSRFPDWIGALFSLQTDVSYTKWQLYSQYHPPVIAI